MFPSCPRSASILIPENKRVYKLYLQILISLLRDKDLSGNRTLPLDQRLWLPPDPWLWVPHLINNPEP